MTELETRYAFEEILAEDEDMMEDGEDEAEMEDEDEEDEEGLEE